MLARVIGRFPPDKVFAELLNEPDVSAERWQEEMPQLAEFVRKLLPDTTLIVGPVNWQRAELLARLQAARRPERRLRDPLLRSDGVHSSGPLERETIL